jgi:hypothetical protein
VSRGWRIGLGVAAAVVAFEVAVQALHSFTGGTPGGPTSSSYATGPAGAAAYAQLLARAGHDVARLRTAPADSALDPSWTVVLLDPGYVSRRDAVALHVFLARGGRLVLGGGAGPLLSRVVADAPGWVPERVTRATPLVPVPETSGVRDVRVGAAGAWDGGAALPVLGRPDAALLDVAAVGRGRAVLLADASPLQNRLLAHGDDARLGLALAGPASRPVRFLETYHGYGRASGFGAIPSRWWAGFALALAAALAFMLARGRRLGPPQLPERELTPPRREYAESLGGVLARTRDHEAAVARLREVAGDAALPRPVRTDADVLAVGRAAARARRESRR